MDKLIVLIDLSLYQASAIIEGEEHYITDERSSAEVEKPGGFSKATSGTATVTVPPYQCHDEMCGPERAMPWKCLTDNQLYCQTLTKTHNSAIIPGLFRVTPVTQY